MASTKSTDNNNGLTSQVNDETFGVSFAEALAAAAFKAGEDKAPAEQYAEGEHLFVEEHAEEDSVEATEREEWEEKPALAPELEVFLGSVRDASELLFGSKGQVQEVVGAKNANDNPYDGGELLSREEQRSQEWEAETPGERDTTVDVEERNTGPNTLQYAYAVLVWSYAQLPADVQAEFSRKFKRLKTYMQNRAKNLGAKLTEGVFPCNRETPLEEYTQGFREEPVDHKVIEDLKGKRKYTHKTQKQESLLEWVKRFK
jgi:hypothetical protein